MRILEGLGEEMERRMGEGAKRARGESMRPIVLIDSHGFSGVAHLRVSEICYLPLCTALAPYLSSPPNALLFSSKHAIYALQRAVGEQGELGSLLGLPALVVGEGCARVWEHLGGAVEFASSSGGGWEFAREVIERARGRSLLYLRARDIAFDLDSRLVQAGVSLSQIVAYYTSPLTLPPSSKPPRDAILIFTAPSNYRFFVRSFGWDSSYTAIAIGRRTQGAFHQGVRAYLSPRPRIQACVELARELGGV